MALMNPAVMAKTLRRQRAKITKLEEENQSQREKLIELDEENKKLRLAVWKGEGDD